MYLKDIINRMRQLLPTLTTKFSERVSISSAAHSGGTVTVTTSSAHNLETGDAITIADCKQKTPISSIETTDGIATVTTSIAHDLTLDYDDQTEQPQVNISGCSVTDYNGSWDLYAVPSRNTFQFEITGSPANASDGFLLESSPFGFSGLKAVTVTGTTTFTFTTSLPLANAGTGGYVHYDIRITGGVDINRLMFAYTKQQSDKFWIFATPEDSVVSKSREIVSDATHTVTAGDDYRQRIISPANIYVVIPSLSDASGRSAYDTALEEITNIIKSIVGLKIPSPYSQDTFARVILEGHGYDRFLQETATYVHRISISTVYDLIYDDLANDTQHYAFRDIDMGYKNDFDENITDDTFKLDV